MIAEKIAAAPAPEGVAEAVLDAVEGKHRMRLPVGAQARLLGRLRRWLPSARVDRSLRKEFRLDR